MIFHGTGISGTERNLHGVDTLMAIVNWCRMLVYANTAGLEIWVKCRNWGCERDGTNQFDTYRWGGTNGSLSVLIVTLQLVIMHYQFDQEACLSRL